MWACLWYEADCAIITKLNQKVSNYIGGGGNRLAGTTPPVLDYSCDARPFGSSGALTALLGRLTNETEKPLND
jgi:hypothetical protein